MYSYDTRVGFSHTDNNRVMTLEAIVNCFQDCSCFQAEHLGIGFDYLEPLNLVWILNSWQIEIKEIPKFYDKITVGTYPYDFKGFFGYRNFFIENEKGEKIVFANSVWTLMDWEKMCPTKLTPQILSKYQKEERLVMPYKSRKITLPTKEEADIIEKESLQIKKYHLDSNQHVNNGQYIHIAFEALDKEIHIKELRAEYRKQAHINDYITPIIYTKNGVYTIALCDKDNQPYAVIEIIEKT